MTSALRARPEEFRRIRSWAATGWGVLIVLAAVALGVWVLVDSAGFREATAYNGETSRYAARAFAGQALALPFAVIAAAVGIWLAVPRRGRWIRLSTGALLRPVLSQLSRPDAQGQAALAAAVASGDITRYAPLEPSAGGWLQLHIVAADADRVAYATVGTAKQEPPAELVAITGKNFDDLIAAEASKTLVRTVGWRQSIAEAK